MGMVNSYFMFKKQTMDTNRKIPSNPRLFTFRNNIICVANLGFVVGEMSRRLVGDPAHVLGRRHVLQPVPDSLDAVTLRTAHYGWKEGGRDRERRGISRRGQPTLRDLQHIDK